MVVTASPAHLAPTVRDLGVLLDHLRQVQAEIEAIRPEEIKGTHIPHALDHLGAILKTNEEAADGILDRCEQLQTLAMELPSDLQDRMTASIGQIFQSCNFQDIAGQRIRLIRQAFGNVDRKISAVTAALGVGEGAQAGGAQAGAEGPEAGQPAAPGHPLGVSPGALLARELERLALVMRAIGENVVSLNTQADASSTLREINDQLLAVIDNATSSTNSILEACDQIREVCGEAGAPAAQVEKIAPLVDAIAAACGFQEKTSHMIGNAVAALGEVETKVDLLALALGVHPLQEKIPEEATASELIERPSDTSLLKGPAVAGQGTDQAEIDRLMGGG